MLPSLYLAGTICERSGNFFWLVVPKFHFWFHLAMFARFSNPRTYWTYQDEDFVGRVARIGASVVRGTGGLKVGRGIMSKYLRVLAMRWQRRLKLRM